MDQQSLALWLAVAGFGLVIAALFFGALSGASRDRRTESRLDRIERALAALAETAQAQAKGIDASARESAELATALRALRAADARADAPMRDELATLAAEVRQLRADLAAIGENIVQERHITRAIDLARAGYGADVIVAQTGLDATEARAIVRFHGAPRG
jgi:hypothetical protein